MSEMTPETQGFDVARARDALVGGTPGRKRRIAGKFILAALESLPWVGALVAATHSAYDAVQDDGTETLQSQWLAANHDRIEELQRAMSEMDERFERLGETVIERVESPEYLGLVRRTFRAWDRAETEEKRRYALNLIANAAGYRLTSDDVVRLFIDWLDSYHEAHFAVIRHLFKSPGATRYDIWIGMHGKLVREDSAEADLFKMLIRDLSTGGVLRQTRETDHQGNFLKKRPTAPRGQSSRVMESAFEDEKQYVLTELGKQFVHYTMNEIVPRVGASAEDGPAA